MSATTYQRVTLRYDVPRARDEWVLDEEPVPESRPHHLTIDLLEAILVAWAARSGRSMQVGCNLAIRWDEDNPQVGADPDVYIVEPPPPEGDEVTSLLLWKTGHFPPLVAVEVVSASNSKKDYASAPERYAVCGAQELWVFDPKLAGPKAGGGPYRLQLWARAEDGSFVRQHAGDGPVFSEAVGGWLYVVDEGRRLRIAEDAEGTDWWPTAEEAERAAKEAERAAKEAALAAEREALAAEEAERAAKEESLAANKAAQARIAELEREIEELRRRG